MTRAESQAYECGTQLADRWRISLDDAQLFLIRNGYWEPIHKPWQRSDER